VDSNPVAFTVRQPERPRKRTLTDAELKAIWKATNGDGDYARIVRLCLLTGCRREEIGGLRTDEIQADRLAIGAKRMKGGILHEVPILPMMAETPASASDSEFVFGRRGTGFSDWSKAKAALDTKIAEEGAALPAWSLHDLRRTFSTRLHDGGVEPLVVEALLAHKQQGVAAVYNRASFWKAKCATLDLWQITPEVTQT
jgi:integrase